MVVVASQNCDRLIFCLWVTACFWWICISPCRGSCSRDVIISTKVYCDMQSRNDYNISYLQGNVSDLRLRIHDDIFAPGFLHLDNLRGLRKLIIDKASQTDRGSTSDFVIDFNVTKSPPPLAVLETLEIHIPLRKIDATLFRHMERLKYLNLSHTLGLKSSYISEVLQNLGYARAPLEHLDLSWSRCFPQLPWDLLNLRGGAF